MPTGLRRKLKKQLLYLRYRLDNGMTKRQANQKILSKYPSQKENTQDAGQSTIRKITHTSKLN